MRRTHVVACSAAAAAAFFASSCFAQAYPTKPVRAIVPYAPGGGVDVMARLVAPRLSANLGQQLVIDNRAGASGTIGAEIASHASPDGYTVLIAGASMAINVSLYPRLPYDILKDFAPVTSIAASPNIVLVHPSLPARSIRDLVALARAQPGKLNYSSGGSGSTLHLTVELFKRMTHVNIVHVPYKSTGPAIVALISGEVAVAMPPLSGMLPYVRSGRLRALAVTSKARVEALPDVPTVEESGVPGFESGQWYGVFVPAGTPPAIVGTLQREFAKVVRAPEVRELIVRQGSIPLGDASEQFARDLRRDIAKWAKVIQASGARAE